MKKEDLVKEIAEILNVDPQEIEYSKRFREDLGADSLELLELIGYLETRLNTTIPDEVMYTLTTLDNVCKFLESKDIVFEK